VLIGHVEVRRIPAPERIDRALQVGNGDTQPSPGLQHAVQLCQRGNHVEVRQVLQHVDADRHVTAARAQRKAAAKV
jgi:hypothetical protein